MRADFAEIALLVIPSVPDADQACKAAKGQVDPLIALVLWIGSKNAFKKSAGFRILAHLAVL